MISILILTKNEEQDISRCLTSVSWSDDVHVFDSFSTDKTVEVAKSFGVKVTQRAFDGYASQRNAALHGLPFKYSWVLMMDADEKIPADLAKELMTFVVDPPKAVNACRIKRRDFFLGSWLQHALITPATVRLVKPRKVAFEREINEQLKVEGETVDLHHHFEHYAFSKGMAYWIEKHNRYSSMEAKEAVKIRRGKVPFSLRKAVLCKDLNERRYHQKRFFYTLPGRPILKWCFMVVGRRAFLDGMPGMAYAALQAIYEYFIVLKERELLQNEEL